MTTRNTDGQTDGHNDKLIAKFLIK